MNLTKEKVKELKKHLSLSFADLVIYGSDLQKKINVSSSNEQAEEIQKELDIVNHLISVFTKLLKAIKEHEEEN